MKGVFWRILFLLILLPPPSHPASSDSFPWSGDPNANSNSQLNSLGSSVHRDAYGAWRDNAMLPDTVSNVVQDRPSRNVANGAIAPGGTYSRSGIAQGNVGPTQSGPGAAALFTPDSPGNAAAYNAQVSGGLVASPIVDGNASNLRIVVPSATPSGVPNYRSVSSGSDPGHDGTNSDQPSNSGPLTVSPAPTTELPASRAIAPIKAWTRKSASSYTRARPGSFVYHFNSALGASAVNSLGQLTGVITYGDGSSVLLGSNGSARIDNRGRVSMPDGTVVPIKSVEKSLRQVAQATQLRL